MSDASRPSATVAVIHLSDDILRVEVSCPFGTTGLRSVPDPNGLQLPVPVLVTAVTFRHEESCSACDTSEAHAQGAPELRQETGRVHAALRQGRLRYYAHGRRN